jgi:hypothetical protein
LSLSEFCNPHPAIHQNKIEIDPHESGQVAGNLL